MTQPAQVLITLRRQCRMCGCTDLRACPGGCSWVGRDLCSACQPPRNDNRRLVCEAA